MPNEILVKRFDGTIIERMMVYRWDLEQWKDSYDDWIVAFEQAIEKRAKDHCFIGLSSGYDSGGIACALLNIGVPFKAFSFVGDENVEVLDQRRERLEPLAHEYFLPDISLIDWMRDNIDNEPYTILCDGRVVNMNILDDGAAYGAATIAKLAKAEGRKVLLSGQGADEIMSDYSPWPEQSELKGTFPGALHLWANFNYSCQESYLMKEEYVAGAFGVENRYPYLDTQLVQEFLALSAEAKNRFYKAPLREYLRRNRFPFEEGAKRGFKVDFERS